MSTELIALLSAAKQLAGRYYELTGRPLGITGEIAEFEAANLMTLDLAAVRQHGFDATRILSKRLQRIQVKGRVVGRGASRGQRLGAISLNKPWDIVMLVILDPSLNALEIWEAPRRTLARELMRLGSKARNERGQLALSQFKRAAKRVWTRPT